MFKWNPRLKASLVLPKVKKTTLRDKHSFEPEDKKVTGLVSFILNTFFSMNFIGII